MPKPRFWAVECNPNRHGRLRWYFRANRAAPRIRLPDTYGSPEFEAAWRAAVAGQVLPGPPQILPRQGRRSSRGSLGWLIVLYLQSPAFLDNRASTQRPRRTMLEKLGAARGSTDIEDITRSVIQDSTATRRETVHMANAWLTTVSNMFEWATQEHLTDPETGKSAPILAANPCEFVKRFPAPRRDDLDGEEDGHPTFTDGDLDAFEAAYSHGGHERLIYEVLLCTGLRVGDAARVGRQHVKDDVLRIKTEKTHTPVALRVLPRLKHALAAGPKGLDTELAWITLKRTGKAMDKNYLGRLFGEACRKIGLERSAHGMRKAAARRYIEAGARPEQLKAIFGWETSAMVDRYTKKFNRERVAVKAMDDFILDSAFAPTLDLGVGGTAKSITKIKG
jgi:integrase